MLLAAIDSALVVICALYVTAAVAQQPRIIGGTAAHSGAYPFFAHIRHNGDPQCGASLISSNWIATAAHCVTVNSTTLGPQPISPASSLTITLGSSHSQDFDDGAFTIPAASIAIHPRYDVHTVMYDFALVELATSVNFTRNIQPIPIDDASHQDYGVLKTVGFGKTNEEASAGSDALMQVDIVKLPDALCSEAYPMFRRANGALFCTGQTPGRDTCFGDSGGPLVSRVAELGEISGESDGHGYALTGIVSFDSAPDGFPVKCGGSNITSYWVNVKAMIPWISEVTGIDVSRLTVLGRLSATQARSSTNLALSPSSSSLSSSSSLLASSALDTAATINRLPTTSTTTASLPKQTASVVRVTPLSSVTTSGHSVRPTQSSVSLRNLALMIVLFWL